MNAVFEIIIFVAFVIVLGFLIYDNIRNRFINASLNKDVAQGLIDLMELKKKLEEMSQQNIDSKVQETEGFLKFVSESRDWAFQYIERVQIAIKDFQDVFHPFAIQYYKDKNKPISQEEFGKIFEAYKKLVDELPEEGKKK